MERERKFMDQRTRKENEKKVKNAHVEGSRERSILPKPRRNKLIKYFTLPAGNRKSLQILSQNKILLSEIRSFLCKTRIRVDIQTIQVTLKKNNK